MEPIRPQVDALLLVGVEMSEKDVANLEAQFLGVSQVLLNIALRSAMIAV
jgi:hypothetical protein